MDKKELKQPDAFIKTSNNLLHYVEKHARPIFTLAGVVVVVSLAYVGYSSWCKYQEKQSALKIYAAEMELKAAQKAVEEEQQKKVATATNSVPRPVDYDSDYKSKVDQIVAVLRETKKTRVALLSTLNLVDFLAQNKRWSDAVEVMKIPEYSPSKSDLLSGLLGLHQGLVALEAGQFDQAVAAYESVVNNSAMGLLHAEALLKLGVTYQAKKDTKKATEIYEQVVQKHGASDSASQARQFLKLLKMNGAA